MKTKPETTTPVDAAAEHEQATDCCSTTEKATCCEPAAKDACCGPSTAARPAKCGCR